jgi:DnaD/phage-associated family protein
MTFTGFPSGGKATAIPNVFFTDLLPLLSDGGDLAVVLCAFRVLGEKRGFPRYITEHDLASEPAVGALQQAKLPNELLAAPNDTLGRESAADAVAVGLRRAVEIGVLLPLTVEREGRRIDLFFLNAPADRRGLEAVRSGSVDIGALPLAPHQPAARSSIFTLYESLIGTISPLVADDLAEAERLYPAEWLQAAFREAAAQNARSWRYVSRILERWAIEGPDHATIERGTAGVTAKDDRYFRGKYGKILKQRLQP